MLTWKEKKDSEDGREETRWSPHSSWCDIARLCNVCAFNGMSWLREPRLYWQDMLTKLRSLKDPPPTQYSRRRGKGERGDDGWENRAYIHERIWI